MSKQPASTSPPESPDDELVRLRRENAELRALVIDQAALIEQLRQHLQELEARLAKDSHNSSKPPSSDPPFKKPAPQSLRKNRGRKPGGQPRHPGATLDWVDHPNQRVTLPLAGACACGQDLSELPATPLPEHRQVTELVIRREVTEYRTVTGTCTCGRVHRSAFPDAVRAPVQYGAGVSAFAVFLTQFHHLPDQRTADRLASVAGMALSPGTLYTLVQEAAARLAAPVAAIGEALIKQTVAHADETGVRIAGKLHGLHVLSATCLTFFAVHAQRGRQALAAIGLLAHFRGILVHDHGSAYAGYDCTHAYCNAHHLRELIAMAETYPRRRWPQALIDLCRRRTHFGGPMEIKLQTADIRWWFWALTLAFIVAALAGWTPGYSAVMAISAVQVVFFLIQERDPAAFPVQIRIVYFALTLFGLLPEVRWYLYLLLLVGTIMVTFFGRCSIALVLRHMPWNRGREVRLN